MDPGKALKVSEWICSFNHSSKSLPDRHRDHTPKQKWRVFWPYPCAWPCIHFKAKIPHMWKLFAICVIAVTAKPRWSMLSIPIITDPSFWLVQEQLTFPISKIYGPWKGLGNCGFRARICLPRLLSEFGMPQVIVLSSRTKTTTKIVIGKRPDR